MKTLTADDVNIALDRIAGEGPFAPCLNHAGKGVMMVDGHLHPAQLADLYNLSATIVREGVL